MAEPRCSTTTGGPGYDDGMIAPLLRRTVSGWSGAALCAVMAAALAAGGCGGKKDEAATAGAAITMASSPAFVQAATVQGLEPEKFETIAIKAARDIQAGRRQLKDLSVQERAALSAIYAYTQDREGRRSRASD